jgi:signal transduction histidine kinase
MISNARPARARLPAEASETLWSQLTQGLHAAAQPLTILLASLGKANTDQMNTAELRELTESSAVQVQRVCTLFRYLQQLVSAASTKAHLSPTPIPPLLAHVVDGVDLLFQEAGICLRASMPDRCPPVLIDRARTIQAFTSVLLVAYAVSSARDTVELILTSTPEGVRVIIRNLHSRVEGINAEGSLSMAAAEANMRSQPASFSWRLKPFHVHIELQKA